MAPLLLCGIGTAFVLVVVRTQGVDVVPDSIGLSLYAVGLWRLAFASRLLVVASALAGVAAVAGLANFAPRVLPAAVNDGLDFTFTVTVGLGLALGAWGIGSIARRAGDGTGWFFVLVATSLLVGVVVFVVGWITNPADHAQAVGLVRSSQLVSATSILAYVVALLVAASRDWAQPTNPTTDKASGTSRRSGTEHEPSIASHSPEQGEHPHEHEA